MFIDQPGILIIPGLRRRREDGMQQSRQVRAHLPPASASRAARRCAVTIRQQHRYKIPNRFNESNRSEVVIIIRVNWVFDV